nr:hypothetical protein [Tanacetum cinerariifolium]
MDSVIPLGQKNTLAEYMILSGADNRLPMLDIDLMKMKQFQVNTKFLNSLPPKWIKFVTDVKLVKYFHTTNFDQIHAYLEQHELHANEVRLLRDDPIACLNKEMAFLTAVASSRVTVKKFQGRQGKSYSSNGYKGNVTSSGGNNASGQARVDNATTIKVKDIWLGNALSLSDQEMQHGIRTKDLDTYDSDCDDVSNTKAVLIANISNYGSDVMSEAQQDSMILSMIEQMSKQMINHVNN